jgi:NAD(P)-dependent dehydrogenase (short-subunit alcohol dehydrogenase family)
MRLSHATSSGKGKHFAGSNLGKACAEKSRQRSKYCVRVNAIAPGLVRTPLTKRIWENPKSTASSRAMHALGRLALPFGKAWKSSSDTPIRRSVGL